MIKTLFIFLLKLYFNFHSFYHLAITDAVCILLPFSFTGAFFLCIYENIMGVIVVIWFYICILKYLCLYVRKWVTGDGSWKLHCEQCRELYNHWIWSPAEPKAPWIPHLNNLHAHIAWERNQFVYYLDWQTFTQTNVHINL